MSLKPELLPFTILKKVIISGIKFILLILLLYFLKGVN